MKDRLLGIAGGLLAFALVVILLVPVPRDDAGQLSRPLSTDRGRAGLQGLQRWLEQGGAQTHVLGRRYSALAASFDLSPVGNLLIVSLPQHTPSRSDEREALHTWLSQGNSALVLTAAGDAPRWVTASRGASTHDFLESFGFEFDMQQQAVAGRADTEENGKQEDAGIWPPRTDLEAWLVGEPVELLPRFHHPLTREVEAVSARSMGPLDRGWDLSSVDGGRVLLPLLGEAENGAAFWEARVGRGRMWVSRYSDLFANVGLGEADNARFMANLVGVALGANGRVIFDDMHQGATDLYDAKAFFSEPRFVNTMIFMVGVWLLYLVGPGPRSGVPLLCGGSRPRDGGIFRASPECRDGATAPLHLLLQRYPQPLRFARQRAARMVYVVRDVTGFGGRCQRIAHALRQRGSSQKT